MKFLIRPRRAGKTTEVIKFLKSTDGPTLLVVRCNSEAKRLSIQFSGSKDFKHVDVISYERLLKHDLLGKKYKSVVYENTDLHLFELVHRITEADPNVLVTATGELNE